MTENEQGFWRQVCSSVYVILAIEFSILLVGARTDPDHSFVASALFRTVFKIHDLLYRTVHQQVDIAHRYYPEPLGVTGGIAQLILPLSGISAAILLTAIARLTFPKKLAAVVPGRWLACIGLLAWAITSYQTTEISATSGGWDMLLYGSWRAKDTIL